MIDLAEEGIRPRAGVILPAAGMGTRLGGQPKQYRLLGGEPLLLRTFAVFDRHPRIDEIIIVVRKGDEEEIRALFVDIEAQSRVQVVAGGASRQASVFAGLSTLSADIEHVLVHDAVRPFVTPENITSVLNAIASSGAAALAVPVADTLRKGAGTHFGDTVSRKNMYRMQTPQGGRKALMLDAHQLAMGATYDATDDVDLIQRAGHPVEILEGHSLNMKVTTPADWQLAQWIWPFWCERNQDAPPSH